MDGTSAGLRCRPAFGHVGLGKSYPCGGQGMEFLRARPRSDADRKFS